MNAESGRPSRPGHIPGALHGGTGERVQRLEEIGTRIQRAASLSELLSASFDAFQAIGVLAGASEIRAPQLFAAFMTTADAAVDGREAVTIAPSLPPPSEGSATMGTWSARVPLGEITTALAQLGALLGERLGRAAGLAAAPGDKVACRDAANAGRRVHDLMAGGEHDRRPG
jgi:hypothetical protein